MNGQPTDISAICEFGWYDWCYYRDPSAKFPILVERLGRFLCPEYHFGTAIYKWVMNQNVNVLPQHTQRSLNAGDINSYMEEWKHKNFYVKIQLNQVYSVSPPKDPIYDQ